MSVLSIFAEFIVRYDILEERNKKILFSFFLFSFFFWILQALT